jgi:hypothetical protein
MKNEGRMIRLIQWFRQRASYLRTEAFTQGFSQTVRTVETVECHEHTLLIGMTPPGALDACPLCGSKLIPAKDEKTLPQLHE